MTQLEQLFAKYGNNQVEVTYPDGKGNHVTTVRDISDRFIQEGAEWRKLWFTSLLTIGENTTRMGGYYKLIRD